MCPSEALVTPFEVCFYLRGISENDRFKLEVGPKYTGIFDSMCKFQPLNSC